MTPPDRSLVEELADRYRVGGSVGEGGMATVYEAEDLRHNRRVAIKVLRPELAAVVGSERFLKEIEVPPTSITRTFSVSSTRGPSVVTSTT